MKAVGSTSEVWQGIPCYTVIAIAVIVLSVYVKRYCVRFMTSDQLFTCHSVTQESKTVFLICPHVTVEPDEQFSIKLRKLKGK